MAMIYSVREIVGTGRFRFVGLSDENEYVCDPLCLCPDGHDTEDEARRCPEAVERHKVIFPSGVQDPPVNNEEKNPQ